MKKPETIDVPVWWKNGSMLSRRDCLPFNHPEHPYNYIRRTYDVSPEEYGIFPPYIEKYKGKTREELLMVISQLEQEIKHMYDSGLF